MGYWSLIMTEADRLIVDKEFEKITHQWTNEMVDTLCFQLSTFLLDDKLDDDLPPWDLSDDQQVED